MVCGDGHGRVLLIAAGWRTRNAYGGGTIERSGIREHVICGLAAIRMALRPNAVGCVALPAKSHRDGVACDLSCDLFTSRRLSDCTTRNCNRRDADSPMARVDIVRIADGPCHPALHYSRTPLCRMAERHQEPFCIAVRSSA